MASWVIAFFFAAGASAWVYAKIDRKDGGQTKTSLIVAGFVFLLAFLIAWSIMSYIKSIT